MMSERIRFHLDENVDPAIAQALQRYGVDVTTTVAAGLRTSSDTTQFNFIQSEQRVIVTHDRDFLRMAGEGVSHPGIAYCQLGVRSVGEMIRTLRLMYEVLTPDDMQNRVEYL